VSQSSASLLNSQLKGVFLVDCPTGIPSGVFNFKSRNLNGLGEELSKRGIKSGDIYNSCSIVHRGTLKGWEAYDLATWKSYIITTGAISLHTIIGTLATSAYYHGQARENSLTVIKSIMNN
jgi:hypothetical protein